MPAIVLHTDAETAPQEQEWLRATFASMGDAVITADADVNVVLLNPAAQTLTGWTLDEARGVPLLRVCNLSAAESRQHVASSADVALPVGAAPKRDLRSLLIAKDGTERAVDDSAFPIRGASGEVVGVVRVVRDATELRRQETERWLADETAQLEQAAWRKSEVQYRRLFESARDGILILDEKTGKIIDANPFMSELLGYDLGYFLGKELWEIGLFKDIAENQAAFRELQTNGYIRYDHLPLATRDKKTVEVEFVSNTYEAGGRFVIQCNIRDSSERVHLQQEVRMSLDEKEVLLKEVHHRVKNNLQVISSLLHLQSLHTQDRASVQMFQESQNRVRSMALIHERLYRSGDLARVDFTDYIENLATTLFSSHRVDADRIGLAVDVQGVKLAIDAAIPCGLLLNELISNCLKHAFQGRERGTIRVELLTINDGDVLLNVSDDGVGIPIGIEPRSAETFGMQLIADLVDQLHGAARITRDAGTAFRIVFPASADSHVQRKERR